jgi:hypothetical protein
VGVIVGVGVTLDVILGVKVGVVVGVGVELLELVGVNGYSQSWSTTIVKENAVLNVLLTAHKFFVWFGANS